MDDLSSLILQLQRAPEGSLELSGRVWCAKRGAAVHVIILGVLHPPMLVEVGPTPDRDSDDGS